MYPVYRLQKYADIFPDEHSKTKLYTSIYYRDQKLCFFITPPSNHILQCRNLWFAWEWAPHPPNFKKFLSFTWNPYIGYGVVLIKTRWDTLRSPLPIADGPFWLFSEFLLRKCCCSEVVNSNHKVFRIVLPWNQGGVNCIYKLSEFFSKADIFKVQTGKQNHTSQACDFPHWMHINKEKN